MSLAISGTFGLQHTYDRLLANKRHFVKLSITIEKIQPDDAASAAGGKYDALKNEYASEGQVLRCKTHSSDADQTSLKPMPAPLQEALKESVLASLGRGPLLGYPLAGIRVSINAEECEVGVDTTPAAVRACLAKCMEVALREANVQLLEPNMALEVVVPDTYVGEVLNDITSHRRGRIKEVTSNQLAAGDGAAAVTPSAAGKTVLRADVPLRELVGYSTALRSRTAGEGTFSMEFAYYAHVGALLQKQLEQDPLAA
jgi:translation elongation factor EF-G